jgi:hypothetical protein
VALLSLLLQSGKIMVKSYNFSQRFPAQKSMSYFVESYLAERFMSFPGPHGNWRGYEESDLNSKVMDLHGQNIFVIHGAGKDLIHHEQSMSLVKALVEANVLFRQQVRSRQF